MFPCQPLPKHITLLFLIAVVNCLALFSHVALVNAEVLVYTSDENREPIRIYHDLEAKFGDPLPMEGFKGLIVYADPPSACQEIHPPPNDTDYSGKWIVLIQRYGCKFERKIRMAQAANYSAAIVHNVNSSELEQMNAEDPSGIYIPSFFVSDFAGYTLREHYVFPNRFYVYINDDLPFNINTHLLLPFAVVVGICFIIMFIFMVVKMFNERRRLRRHRLPSSSLKKIPISKFKKGDPYETCAICLEDYQEGEKLRLLPCNHAYHCKCIDPWLTGNRRVCPVCKRKVFAHDEPIPSSDSETDTDDTTPLINRSASVPNTSNSGTFVEQNENPFTRAHREQGRRGSFSSINSGELGDQASASTVRPSERVPNRRRRRRPRLVEINNSPSNSGEPDVDVDVDDLNSTLNTSAEHSINSHTERTLNENTTPTFSVSLQIEPNEETPARSSDLIV